MQHSVAARAKTLQILADRDMSGLHVRDMHPVVMDLYAGVSSLRSVPLDRVQVALLAKQATVFGNELGFLLLR